MTLTNCRDRRDYQIRRQIVLWRANQAAEKLNSPFKYLKVKQRLLLLLFNFKCQATKTKLLLKVGCFFECYCTNNQNSLLIHFLFPYLSITFLFICTFVWIDFSLSIQICTFFFYQFCSRLLCQFAVSLSKVFKTERTTTTTGNQSISNENEPLLRSLPFVF